MQVPLHSVELGPRPAESVAAPRQEQEKKERERETRGYAQKIFLQNCGHA